MKSKESVKTLILHIIGLVIHLSTGGVAHGHFLARILKTDMKELSSYFRELGAYTEIKPRTQKAGYESKDDQKVENTVLVSFRKIHMNNNGKETQEENKNE